MTKVAKNNIIKVDSFEFERSGKRCFVTPLSIRVESREHRSKSSVGVIPGQYIASHKWRGVGKNLVLPFNEETTDKFAKDDDAKEDESTDE